jgi:hypothetical protein
MPTCKKLVTVIGGQEKPCLCIPGHAGGCNPFSPNPYMSVVKSAIIKDNEKPIITKATKEDYRLRDGDVQCFWCGVHGRCILRLGHFPDVPHIEDAIKK